MQTLRITSGASRISFENIVLSSFEVRLMPVEALWPPVSAVPIFVEELKESISEKGLLNPIIVVRLPYEDIIRHFNQSALASQSSMSAWGHNLPDTPVVNVIWGGSNRLAAVKELGYTHVDCLLMPDFHIAIQIQNLQRSAYSAARDKGSEVENEGGEQSDGIAGQKTG